MTDDLNGVMRSATENLYPNIGKLTAGGIERGVRRRRNRRITQVVGAAASVTAVFGVVAAVGAPGHGGPAAVSAASGTTPPAVAQTSAAAAAPTPGTDTPASAPAAKPGQVKSTAPVSGDDMVKWLQQSVAQYQFTGEKVLYQAGTDEAAGPYATLRIGYAAGAGSVSLTVSRSPWSSLHIGGAVPYTTVSTLGDGSHLIVFDGPEWPAGNGDPSAKRVEASWYRTDGTLVDVQVLNEVQEKGATTATRAGLTADQAAKLVQSPVWDKAIASVLAEPAPVILTPQSGAKGGTTDLKLTDTLPGSGSGSTKPTTPAAPPAH